MRFRRITPLAVCLLTAFVATLGAQSKEKRLRADLAGSQEVPVVSSTGHGQFVAQIDAQDGTFTYELSYDALEGTVTQSHIHLGQLSVNGGSMIWLCGTAANPGPGGTPACPMPGDSVGRTVGPADVVGPAGQGIAAAEWEEALAALRGGVAYANVHSTKHPGGEIRGQVNSPR
jgi:hypothetical protein